MKKYMALFMAPRAEIEKAMATMTPEQGKEEMAEWQAWMDAHAESFVDKGAILGKTKRVSADGITDVKNEITGYSVVQAESHEAAAEIFKSGPHFTIPGATVELIAIVEM
jgi:hypothetical protein